MPKVSVIIPVYNYGRFLNKALESVFAQRFKDYEVIVIDDASNDNTGEVLREFKSRRALKLIVHQENKGLVRSAHEAIVASTGEYIIRLDPDDYFDENALLVLSSVLDDKPHVGLVYSDYFLVSTEGRILDYVRLPRVYEEIELLDVPANGAGTMFRRSSYEAVGGYDVSLTAQDGYDLWLKFTRRFKVDNVNLPLYYYRRHGLNLTTQKEHLLENRRYIKERFARDENIPRPVTLGIIPARSQDFCNHLVLRDLAGKPLIAYSVQEAMKAHHLAKLVVTTEDREIARVAKDYGARVVFRPPELTQGAIEHTVLYVLEKLKEEGFHPEAVAILHANSPFKKAEHIDEAINTLAIFEVDSVVSVCEDIKFHYRHGAHGLNPLFKKRALRLEKQALYEENGAIYVSRVESITSENFLGKRLGHITMGMQDSIHLDSEFDFWLAERMAEEKKTSRKA